MKRYGQSLVYLAPPKSQPSLSGSDTTALETASKTTAFDITALRALPYRCARRSLESFLGAPSSIARGKDFVGYVSIGVDLLHVIQIFQHFK
jgi:hypothetical protein